MKLQIENLPQLPRGAVTVVVSFNIERNGKLVVTAELQQIEGLSKENTREIKVVQKTDTQKIAFS